MSDYVILVDENDHPIGQQEKLKAHQFAECHRAFSVFIYRFQSENEIEILLQQRHSEKYHCAGLWTNTCCGHPRPGEDTLAAANRRLYEEMGINAALKEIGVFHYIAHFDNGLTENEVDHVFMGQIENQTINPHPQEVSHYRWSSIPDLRKAMQKEPRIFTPWLEQALSIFSQAATP